MFILTTTYESILNKKNNDKIPTKTNIKQNYLWTLRERCMGIIFRKEKFERFSM